MKGTLFSTEELEHRVANFGEIPPVGTQFWEIPADKTPASVVDNRNGSSTLFLLFSEEDFERRPLGSRLVAFPKNKVDFQPQRQPKATQLKKIKQLSGQRTSYRNLAQIFG